MKVVSFSFSEIESIRGIVVLEYLGAFFLCILPRGKGRGRHCCGLQMTISLTFSSKLSDRLKTQDIHYKRPIAPSGRSFLVDKNGEPKYFWYHRRKKSPPRTNEALFNILSSFKLLCNQEKRQFASASRFSKALSDNDHLSLSEEKMNTVEREMYWYDARQ
jgi:hypothetical protein